MSSSPGSPSSPSLVPAEAVPPPLQATDAAARFDHLLDVSCPVTIVLGAGHISVRQCLALERDSVVRLAQPAGHDLLVLVGDVPVARGEVVIADDTTAVRVTEIVSTPGLEGRA